MADVKEKPITRLGMIDLLIREYNETHADDETSDGSEDPGTTPENPPSGDETV